MGTPLAATPASMATRPRRLREPLLTAGLALAGVVALHVRDPHAGGSWGYCPWLLLTGTYCPGCGGLRAVNDLSHGDVAGAFSSNALLVVLAPLVVVLWGRSLLRAWRGTPRVAPPRAETLAWAVLGVVAIGFAVLRNLPVGAGLAP